MPDTRQARLFRREYDGQLETEFPTPASVALAGLARGQQPADSAILVL